MSSHSLPIPLRLVGTSREFPMLLNIIALCVALFCALFVCAFVAGARTTGTTTTAAPAAPAAKDQRPLWAREELRDIPAAAAPLDPWQEKIQASYTREGRRALAALDHPVPSFTPSPEPPPERKFLRPLKAKGRNSA